MGFNTTVVIMNDSLNEINSDKDFGHNLYKAILKAAHNAPVDVSSHGHVNAATVVESHHADGIKMIAVGGNYARDLGYVGSYRSEPEDWLKALAESMGYRVVKKRAKK